MASRYLRLPVAVADWLAGDAETARDQARTTAAIALATLPDAPGAEAEEDAMLALGAVLLLQRLGDQDSASKVLVKLETYRELLKIPQLSEMATVARAEQIRLAGRPSEAIQMLRLFLTGGERYQTHVVLMKAFEAIKDYDAAVQHAQWLQQRRGLAYTELECGYCLQALNVADRNLAIWREAELLDGQRKTREASRRREDFNRLWPVEVLPSHLRR